MTNNSKIQNFNNSFARILEAFNHKLKDLNLFDSSQPFWQVLIAAAASVIELHKKSIEMINQFYQHMQDQKWMKKHHPHMHAHIHHHYQPEHPKNSEESNFNLFQFDVQKILENIKDFFKKSSDMIKNTSKQVANLIEKSAEPMAAFSESNTVKSITQIFSATPQYTPEFKKTLKKIIAEAVKKYSHPEEIKAHIKEQVQQQLPELVFDKNLDSKLDTAILQSLKEKQKALPKLHSLETEFSATITQVESQEKYLKNETSKLQKHPLFTLLATILPGLPKTFEANLNLYKVQLAELIAQRDAIRQSIARFAKIDMKIFKGLEETNKANTIQINNTSAQQQPSPFSPEDFQPRFSLKK
jgi:hypothetical protein